MSETTTLLVALFTVAVFTFYRSSTKSSIGALYRVGQQNRTVFRLDDFVTVSPRKACSMSKFSKFYREKDTKLAFQ